MVKLRESWLDGDQMRPWLRHYPARVRATLDYPDKPLGWLLEEAACRFPRRVACCYYSQQVSYDELLSRARRFASVLMSEGLQPGDRVGVLLPNFPECLVTLFGVWMAGGVVVALSPLMVAAEVGSFVKSTGCRIIVTIDLLLPLLWQCDPPPDVVLVLSLSSRLTPLERLGYAWVRFRRLGIGRNLCPGAKLRDFEEAVAGAREQSASISIDSSAPAYILPTGGTTGAPKAVLLAHRNLMANAWQLSEWSPGEPGGETILGVIPFFHSYGLTTCVMNGVVLGATIVMHHRFRPQSAVRLIERHRPSALFAVPAMLTALNAQMRRKTRDDLSSLKVCMSGGAPLPLPVAEEFTERTGCEVVEGYGLSEASPVTHSGPLDGTAIPGTVGLPVPDTDAAIVDATNGTEMLPYGEIGELVIRGPQVMLGYWNDQPATDRVLRDGWLHTGDLATCDERGFFRIVDRQKDLIITSGFNVYPADVEAVLRTYPGVRDVAVIGEPDDNVGELVKAIIVLEERTKLSRRDFDAFVQRSLSAQQRPKIVETRTGDLPRNFLGKVLRRELRDAPRTGWRRGGPEKATSG